MGRTIEIDVAHAQDTFFERGWTDGLPIVPPTLERVRALLDAGGREPDETLGSVSQRSRSVSAEEAAINAVMAGCAPEHFPLVVAGVSAMLDPAFNAHAVLTSTGGAALCLVASGPLAAQAGMNARHNVLGPGNRANATIGRALRLIAINVLDARTGGMDGSSIGNPGKYTLCFPEDEPPEPWEPLRVELGYEGEDTTVTLLATEGPRQVANHLCDDGEGVLRTFAAAMRNPATFCVGKGGQCVVLLGPEHAAALVQAGWTRAAVREFLAHESRVTSEELESAGVLIETGAQHDMRPGDDGKLPAVPGPDDVFLVTAGGAGAGWSAYLPEWAPTLHSRAVTRRVTSAGEELPDCGPDSCEVDLAAVRGWPSTRED
jgi:hypothetical protein